MVRPFMPLCISLLLAIRIPYGIHKHPDYCDRYECPLILMALTGLLLIFYIPFKDMFANDFRGADRMHFLAAVGLHLCALGMPVGQVREAGEVEAAQVLGQHGLFIG
jgi:ABC-type transport system involved in cytochrome c biogenesis permease subunit